jgi:hypothetical protein
MVAFKNQIVTL